MDVGIDLDALTEAARTTEPWRVAEAHREAVRSIVTCGVLRLAGPTEIEDLRAAVRSLPDSLKKIWSVLLVDRPNLVQSCSPEAPLSVRDIESYHELVDVYAERLRVVLVSSARAEVGFELAEDQARADVGAIEIARFEAVWSSSRLTEARDRSYVPAGTAREVVWDWIAPAAAISRRITILDRYASAGLVATEIHGDRGRGGASWLLRQIHRTVVDAEVRLITAQGEGGRTAEQVVEAASRVVGGLGAGGIRRLVVDVAGRPGDLVHDRHIRFSNVLAVSIGGGVDEFSRHTSSDGYVFARLPTEEALRRERRTDPILSHSFRTMAAE